MGEINTVRADGSPPQTAAELDRRLARIARATSNGMVLLDAAGRIEWVNEGFSAISGYTLNDCRGLTPCALLESPHSDPETLAAMRAHIAAGEGYRTEIQLQGKDQRQFWVDLDVRPTYDAAGVHDGFVSVQTEVTSAKQLEAQLKATSASLRSAGHLARLGGWEVDRRANVVRWSPDVQKMLGRSARVEKSSATLEIFPEHERDRVRAYIQEAMQTGERIEFDSPIITPSGGDLWFRVVGEPEMVDGKCVAVHGAMQDVTAQRQAHAELLESERFGRGVIDGVAAMLTVIDETGAIVAANQAFRSRGAELTNGAVYPLGRNLFDVLARLPGNHGKALDKGLRGILSGKAQSFIRAYQAVSGEWFRMTAARFAGEGPVRCVVITQSVQDLKESEERLRELNVTLERARDEANAANDAKSAFLATMSHEIRTPLNGVLGMAQAMARDELPNIQRERLTVIRQAGETLLALLNDLLDLSRIEAGRLELEDSSLDVEQLVQGAHATFTTLATEKDVSFAVTIAPEARGVWAGDPTRVRQIVYNLVSNAVKFTDRGEISVQVSVAGPHLVFKVSDTGPGIAADRLGALFQKFVQEDASTTRRFGGSGLGLAICRELATLMGGDIKAASVLGQGSVFTVRLPLKRIGDAGGQTVRDERLEAPPLRDGSALRILAAEDNPMNQLVLRTLLAQVGIEVTCVDNGELAVAAAASGDWDAILMDVQMPVMDGPTATRLIREWEKADGHRRTPIIALTANAMSHHAVEYTAAGMDVLVPKPLELERLLIAIQTVLDEDDADQLDIVSCA
ncbi:MAG: PAS domain S-box protein [Phenylobacterium sp.]|uniref:PAS domain-containing hybrid sensor histidine kinase/response regulator n=1 Tax=Phenylobacterium sp. TaxID=1871053 RepID=UPI001B489E7B|nr:PAS domain-containing hybrid sensor histidine kinase/response regulator [Phenylobacterium sp.]MBP7815876.1 PAS domain S-box protein [Phenylobacterium sp.]MBP9231657.1 PAS domain S-box protein [Phenylobacterium sp.]MBP9753586.1 PAS domain S-box protein [Phenylobacterium sp.]